MDFQQTMLCLLHCTIYIVYPGSEINFFRQVPTGNWIFSSRQMEKCGRQKGFSFAAKHKQMENSGRQFFF